MKQKYKQKYNLSKLLVATLVFVALFFAANISRAAINSQINYQGKLTDAAGVAKADGNYNMVISIYDAVSGGNCVWTSRGTCSTPTARSVALLNGIFSIMLGDTGEGDNALTGLDFNSAYYLGVAVGSDAEMTPRKAIGAAGYAFNSGMLNGLASATSGANAHVMATDSSGNATISGSTYFNGTTYYVNSSGTGNLNGLTLAGDLAVNGNDITSTGALTVTPAAGSNFNLSLSGTGDFAVNTNQFYVDTSAGKIGIGNATPSAALHIGTTAPTNLGSTANSLMVSGGLEVAGSAYLGPMEFPTDAGAISWIAMPVSASAATGTVESYSASLGGTNVLTVYGLANGSGGGINNPRVGIGTSSPTGLLHLATSTTALGATVFEQASADIDPFDLILRKARGTIGSPTVVTAGDELGNVRFSGYSGVGGYVTSASIKAISEGTIATTRVPGALTFSTGTDAASTVLTERMRINSAGNVGIGTTAPNNNLQIGAQTVLSTATPVTFSLGGTYSSTAGANPKIKLFDDGSTASYGLGVSNSSFDTMIPTGAAFNWYINGSQKMILNTSGNLGIGVAAPSAYLNIKAGTATSSTAPLKFTAGTNLTTAEAGAMEWDGTNLFITQTGPIRKTLAYTTDLHSAVTLGTANGLSLSTQTLSLGLASAGVTGALSGTDWSTFNGKENALTFSTGLTRATNSITNNLSTGISGGQTLIGSTSTDSGLTIKSTTGVGTSGADIIFQTGNNGGNEAMRILNSGNIGVGINAPTALLHLAGTAGKVSLEINSNETTAANNVLMIRSDLISPGDDAIFRVQADGAVYADGTYTGTGADYAEYFYTQNTDLKSGEVVCVDMGKENAVKRCERSGDNNVMGVVSTKPSVVGNGNGQQRENDPNYKIIGMMGQVPGLVSAENGSIKIGDNLTSANVQGYMRKANAGESTVGVAMQNFNGEKGTIQVLISRRNQSLTVEKIEQSVSENIASMNIQDKVNTIVNDAVANLNSQIKNLSNVAQSQISLVNTDVASIQTMQNKLQDQMDLISKQTDANSDFIVSLNIDDIIYKDALGNISLPNGKILAKNVEATESVKAKNIELGGGVSGTAKIKGGELKSEPILTEEIRAGVKIYITPKDSTEGKVLYYDEKDIEDKKSFVVKIDAPVLEKDVEFNWLIVK